MEHDDLERRIGDLGTQPLPPGLATEHLTKMATVGVPSRWPSKLRVGAAFLVGLLLGGSGLAAAGALPDPVQHAAYEALDTVGVEVPDPERYHGEECGDEVKRNHGAYVRDDHSLAKTRCGKPIKAGGDDDGEEGAGGGEPKEKGPCQGPPPWAKGKGKSMTPEEKAAAQAEREAQCPDDEAEDEAEAEDEERGGEAEGETEGETTTTTTVAETTTTTVADTTTTESTTTTTG